MISNPKFGWCEFELGDFKGTPSYLTDIPLDLLTAFIDLHSKGSGIAWFDEEGAWFSLVLTPYSIFIIEEKKEPVLIDISDMNIRQMEEELISDIEKELTGWSEFLTTDDKEEIQLHREEIRQKIAILRKAMGV